MDPFTYGYLQSVSQAVFYQVLNAASDGMLKTKFFMEKQYFI